MTQAFETAAAPSARDGALSHVVIVGGGAAGWMAAAAAVARCWGRADRPSP
ncbi:hypothetical protein ACRAWD_09580 [Caulobacter segnis]